MGDQGGVESGVNTPQPRLRRELRACEAFRNSITMSASRTAGSIDITRAYYVPRFTYMAKSHRMCPCWNLGCLLLPRVDVLGGACLARRAVNGHELCGNVHHGIILKWPLKGTYRSVYDWVSSAGMDKSQVNPIQSHQHLHSTENKVCSRSTAEDAKSIPQLVVKAIRYGVLILSRCISPLSLGSHTLKAEISVRCSSSHRRFGAARHRTHGSRRRTAPPNSGIARPRNRCPLRVVLPPLLRNNIRSRRVVTV